ncbi:MAG: hypothetical protein QM446_07335 [Synergistota bacterium]|nr:hypothetical protein [Synergistota bacterium]
MKTRLTRSILSGALLIALMLLPAASRADTLQALGDLETPFLVLHLEKLDVTAGRLSESGFAFGLLDSVEVENRDSILEWLRGLPVASLSFGLDSNGIHGAVAFREDSERSHEILSILSEGEEANDDLIAELFGRPDDDGMREAFDVTVEQDEGLYWTETDAYGILYNLLDDWEFFASIESSPTGLMLLLGSSPDQVEKAREALAGELSLEIERSTDGDSFLLVVDDGDIAEMLFEEFGVPVVPEASLSLKASLEFPEDGIALSIRHNLLDMLLGDSQALEVQELDASGLKFGGGSPFFSAIGALPLTGEMALEIVKTLTDTDDDYEEELVELLKSEGIDLDEMASTVGFFGALIGGRGAIGKGYAPGGYIFVSGEPEGMKALVLLFELLLDLSSVFDSAERKGWDLFYAISEELR